MLKPRISLVSYNLWNIERWPDRESALVHFLKTFIPDIFCVQELRPETLHCIDQTLINHDHVKGDQPGWKIESNIFWNREIFDLIEYGLEDLKMLEKERGFFWVRLKMKANDKSIFISTAHFTWQGSPDEKETGLSPRIAQTKRTIEFLQKLVKKDDVSFFMGDLNDPVVPVLFFPGINYKSCFKELGILSPPTYPALPTTNDICENQAIDWMFCNGKAKALSAFVPQFYFDGISPSDHWPIHAFYEI
ncbi:MAG: hypothetical protein COA79_06750 [Planctomycetota bacterium]|nr:MAG: hypothetical protein COA79_06750 [Planctomycetota bacterium]